MLLFHMIVNALEELVNVVLGRDFVVPEFLPAGVRAILVDEVPEQSAQDVLGAGEGLVSLKVNLGRGFLRAQEHIGRDPAMISAGFQVRCSGVF